MSMGSTVIYLVSKKKTQRLHVILTNDDSRLLPSKPLNKECRLSKGCWLKRQDMSLVSTGSSCWLARRSSQMPGAWNDTPQATSSWRLEREAQRKNPCAILGVQILQQRPAGTDNRRSKIARRRAYGAAFQTRAALGFCHLQQCARVRTCAMLQCDLPKRVFR